MPIQVSRDITLPSTHHSPRTVNKNAREFVIGTVRLSSACPINRKNQTLPVTFNSSGIAYAGFLRRS